MITVETFRSMFNAFADPGVYDENAINMFITIAYSRLNGGRWGATLDYGASMFVAHHMALTARDNATVDAGGLPGDVQGVKSAKSVDKVSISYAPDTVALTDGEFWNMTTYGIQFLRLARMMGSGGMQVNGCGGGWGGAPWGSLQ